jgi:hypothetical protein
MSETTTNGVNRRLTERVGETRTNQQGLTMVIREYQNCKKILIEFVETGEQRWTSYWKFTNGKLQANTQVYPVKEQYQSWECKPKTVARGCVAVLLTFIVLMAIGAIWLR